MVDIDPESPDELRFVVSHSPTLASSILIQVSSPFVYIRHVADHRQLMGRNAILMLQF